MQTRRMVLKVVYWIAVLAVSLLIVFALVLLFESLDDAGVGEDAGGGTRQEQREQQPQQQPPLRPLPDL
jgi:hypothetical protein